MNSVNQVNTTVSNETVETAKSLRKLYFLRTSFSIVWVVLVLALAKTNAGIASFLFISYPTWDVIATFLDIKANPPGASKKCNF